MIMKRRTNLGHRLLPIVIRSNTMKHYFIIMSYYNDNVLTQCSYSRSLFRNEFRRKSLIKDLYCIINPSIYKFIPIFNWQHDIITIQIGKFISILHHIALFSNLQQIISLFLCWHDTALAIKKFLLSVLSQFYKNIKFFAT